MMLLALGAQLVAGQMQEIRRESVSSSRSSDGSTSSSRDIDTVRERVIAVRGDQVELEYDLLPSATAQDRKSAWQFPVQVARAGDGSVRLLDREGLARRAAAWLRAAKLPASMCGRSVFTWNVFRIECEPESALRMIATFDVFPPVLAEGAPYRIAGAMAAVPLVRDGAGYAARLAIDPAAVRHERAEGDVVTGEVLRQPVTLAQALAARAKEQVTGTIAVTFAVDGAGAPWRRTVVTSVETRGADGRSETQTATETVERRPVAVTR